MRWRCLSRPASEQHPPGPAIDVELAHGACAGSPCARAARPRGMVSACWMASAHLLDVVGVDDQRLGQLARRAGEAAQDQHALLVVARGDELLGDQVHAVVQAGHQADVGSAVQLVDAPRARGAARAGSPAGTPAPPKRWSMRSARRSMRSWNERYSSSELRVGAATCTKVKLADPLAGASPAGARPHAAARGCPWCSRSGRRRRPDAGPGQAQPREHRGAGTRSTDGQLRLGLRRGPGDRDRVALDEGLARLEGDRRVLVLDARLEVAVDRLEEVLAVEAACGSRGWCCRACPRASRAATGRCRTIPGSARGCARTSGSSPRAACRGSSPAAARSGSPARGRSGPRCAPRPPPRRRSAG